MGLGISALALMAFGFSRALCAVLRPLAGREPRHLVNAVLLSIGLVASAASAEPLSPDAQPTPLAKPVGAPVLGQAENATTDTNSLNAEGSSPSSTAAPSITINPKSAKSDQNCLALAKAAAAHDLPLDFFVRLIRQESNFDPNSLSHAGAQGIAQFMPGTARWRGLADPFEPLQSNLATWDSLLQPIMPAQDGFRTGLPAGDHCLVKHGPMCGSSQEELPKNGRAARLKIVWIRSNG